MLEVKVSISPELLKHVFGLRMLFAALVNYLFVFVIPVFLAWIVIAIIDTANNQGALITKHGIGLAALALLLAFYMALRHLFRAVRNGSEFLVRADEHGMTADSFISWSAFSHYRAYDRYYLLTKHSGNSTLIPNTPELATLLDLIRQRLPSHEQARKTGIAASLREFLRNVWGFTVVAGLTLALLVAVYFASIPAPPFADAQLIDNPAQYLGKHLAVEPFYGWGWANSGGEPVEVPAPLVVELQELLNREGLVIGGIGKVVTPDHLLSGYWMEFSLRHTEEASLAVKKADYNMGFAPVPFTTSNDASAFTADSTGTRYFGWGLVYAVPDEPVIEAE